MSTLLVDTNVVSYIFRGSVLAGAYRPLLEGHQLAVSFMTVGELYEGAFRAQWSPERLARLEDLLRTTLTVVGATSVVCRHWGQIRTERRAQPISAQDGWIAACARASGWPLVTHDARDFAGIAGLTVITAAPR